MFTLSLNISLFVFSLAIRSFNVEGKGDGTTEDKI